MGKSFLIASFFSVAAFAFSQTAFSQTSQPAAGPMTQIKFGQMTDGRTANLFTLTNKNGLIAKITDYGGHLAELYVPDRNGKFGDIVLGFDSLAGYVRDGASIGATVGRVANRTAGAKFTLDGKDYTLTGNMHGGRVGFSKHLWQGELKQSSDGPSLVLKYTSADGEEGFPGKMDCTVIYTLTDQNELRIEYSATTDKPTIVNLTNHSYFNLSGPGSGDVRKTVVQIDAAKYTPEDAQSVPTGEIASVDGSPLDFRKPKPIGQDFDKVTGGYDHNFVLDKPLGEFGPAAKATDPATGRVMEVFTTEPGVQFYTANYLNGTKGIGGTYGKVGALCLETQHYPDSIHHDNFPTIVLQPGQTFSSKTVYRFSTVQ